MTVSLDRKCRYHNGMCFPVDFHALYTSDRVVFLWENINDSEF